MDVGLAYDDGSLYLNDKWHISGKATFGLPIWSVTSNTQFEDVDFYDFGYRAAVEGTVSYEVIPGFHLGWYTMFGYEKRFQSDTETVTTTYCKTMVDGVCTEYVTEQKRRPYLKPTRSLSVLAYRHCGAFKRQGLDTER